MSSPNRICFLPETGDNAYFGSSVVVNEQYLAVSDPGANKVIIYTRNSFGNWLRTREILPPVNSVPHRVGHGFGRNLKLDDDALLISDEVILISSETEKYVKGIVDPQEFQFVDSVPVFVNRYLVKLSSKAELQRIKFYPSTILGLVEFITLSKGEF